jgi:DNA-binding IclR family transcriptional regulator
LSQVEVFSEVAGMAAPVFNHEDSVCGSVTIAGPKQRFTEDRHHEMLTALLDAARKLSALMGYSG